VFELLLTVTEGREFDLHCLEHEPCSTVSSEALGSFRERVEGRLSGKTSSKDFYYLFFVQK
jgi:hypothetical protein